MADTIVNTPGNTNSDGAAGWAIAAVVIIAVIIGAVLLFRNGLPTSPNTGGGTNINVELPSGGGATGGTGGGATQ